MCWAWKAPAAGLISWISQRLCLICVPWQPSSSLLSIKPTFFSPTKTSFRPFLTLTQRPQDTHGLSWLRASLVMLQGSPNCLGCSGTNNETLALAFQECMGQQAREYICTRRVLTLSEISLPSVPFPNFSIFVDVIFPSLWLIDE